MCIQQTMSVAAFPLGQQMTLLGLLLHGRDSVLCDELALRHHSDDVFVWRSPTWLASQTTKLNTPMLQSSQAVRAVRAARQSL